MFKSSCGLNSYYNTVKLKGGRVIVDVNSILLSMHYEVLKENRVVFVKHGVRINRVRR